MDTLDELLPIALSSFVKCLAIVSTAFVVAAVAAPAALAVSPLVFLVFHWLGAYFQRTASQLKRLEKASTGPLFSLYGETLQGVTSIRAFGRQAAFETTLLQRLDQNHRAHFLWTASNRWFAARLDILTASVTLSVGLAVVLFRDQLEPSLAALALTYVVQTTSLFQWGFRMWAEVRNHFVSVELTLTLILTLTLALTLPLTLTQTRCATTLSASSVHSATRSCRRSRLPCCPPTAPSSRRAGRTRPR